MKRQDIITNSKNILFKRNEENTMNKFLLMLVFMIFVNSSLLAKKKSPSDFLPQGYVISEKYYGDLNKDGEEDLILIIKGSNVNNIVINRFNQKVDRNRRGIIILLSKNHNYQLAVKNYDCFSSENEDGGVYFPPDLWIETEKGNLIIHYLHGRYGSWRYIFRFQNSDFKLIRYDSNKSQGPITNRETSINFLTKKKLIKENINENSQGGDEIFKEMWERIEINKLLNLSEISNFDELDI